MATGFQQSQGFVPGGYLIDKLGQHQTFQHDFVDLVNASTQNVVAAQGENTGIRVVAACYIAAATATANFGEGALDSTGAQISGKMSVGINGGFVWPFNPAGWVQTRANLALTFRQSASVNAGVQVTWCKIGL